MQSWRSRIELASNVAVIVLCAILAFVLVKRYFVAPSGSTIGKTTDRTAQVSSLKGKQIAVRDVDWSQKRQSLVLALRSDCHFCSDSASFYKELVQRQNERQDLQLIALLPEPVDKGKA